ncbi:MAG TPA: PAS domain-containing protein [Candidatus Cybelea sp.]|nr:PAS domain-containing protein [Candidatus Cybelea sp.]
MKRSRTAEPPAEPLKGNGVGAVAVSAAALARASDSEHVALPILLAALQSMRDGDFSVRLPGSWTGLSGKIADTFNDIAAANQQMACEMKRMVQVVGKEGRTRERARFRESRGAWGEMETSVSSLTEDLLRPTTEVTRAIAAVAQGNLTQQVRLDVDGRPLEGEFLRSASIVNTMIQQLAVFTSEVIRVAREVGTDGKLGGQAVVPGVAGTWKDLTDSVNLMASNLTGQVRNIAEVATAVASGDLSRKITVDVRGEILQLKEAINTMVDQLRSFASEVTRVAREVGTDEIRRMLEETQERLVLAQHAANCGTFDYDVRTRVNFWSDELQRLYGFVPGGFPRTYEGWLDCVLPEDREIARAPEQASPCRFFDTEFRIRRRDNGEIRWMNSRGRIQRDGSGKAIRVVGLNIDITRTKRVEEDLKRAHEELKGAHEELEVRVQDRTAELRTAQDRLRKLTGRLMRSQDEERRRIARELHDGLGQYLVAVKMNLDVLAMSAPARSGLLENLTDAIKQIENAIAEVRTMSHLLHPPLLDEVGLELALVWYAEGFAKRSGIDVEVDISPALGRLDTEAETALFRVVQECLTNVHRHSGSATASVRLSRENGGLRLEVCDEGRGMPTLPSEEVSSLAPGVGLQGIRERVLQLRGKVDITSSEGEGTTVTVTIPDTPQTGVAGPAPFERTCAALTSERPLR